MADGGVVKPSEEISSAALLHIVSPCGFCDVDIELRLLVLGVWADGHVNLLCPTCRGGFERMWLQHRDYREPMPPLGYLSIGKWMSFAKR
jgi:hypothetical protein